MKQLENLKYEKVSLNVITKLPNVVKPNQETIYLGNYVNKKTLNIHNLVYIYTDDWYLIDETIVEGSLEHKEKSD